MKTFIIAAITADGFIARADNELVSWTSKADKAFFRDTTKRAGTMIMGSRTFETIGKALPGRRTIVMSRTKKFNGVETTNESPKELVARLQKEGVHELAICGGSAIYTSFMKEGLVDTVYLTVEGMFFGSGVHLFKEKIEAKMELRTVTNIGEGSVVLEYSVIR